MAIDNYHRILKKTEHSSFFLFGVRGSGKSTWTSKLPKIAKTINLLNEELYQKILLNPVYFTGEIESLSSGAWVVVDEIQRAPFLLNEIHRFIEEKKLKFILTGSSARKLRRAGVNLLAGRALVREMYPLLPEEMGKDFNLEKTLRFGAVALIIASEADPSERLKAYVQTYLKEEIRAEALVRNLQGFVRFLPVAALFHAQVINVSGVSRDVGVERTTVEGFLDVLEDTLFTFRLPAYFTKLKVRERKHPKLYWIDPGLVRAAKGQLGEVAIEERGSLFEGWIAQTLRSYQSYRNLFEEMFYWSPLEVKDIEVDFLLRRGKDLIAIEAKVSNKIKPEFFKGLNAISDLKSIKRRILVYLGKEKLKTRDGIDVLPWRYFLENLEANTLWESR